MVQCKAFYDALGERGIDFFVGVPDSLLKNFCAYITDHAAPGRHMITANEGCAIAIAAGHYLGSGELGLVYMQNSGLSNAVNPLTSLADAAVYGIPMVLVIGWRGQPGKKDEPQHVKMGGITRELLATIGVPFQVLPDTLEAATETLDHALKTARDSEAPFALVVPKGTFETYALQNKTPAPYDMPREEAIGHILDHVPADALIVSTTGKASRELFETREARSQGHDTDFLTVGSMGHTSQITLGVALAKPDRPVFCFDGDGAAIMHMGGLSTIAAATPTNYRHIVLNNGAHDSVGGQPTVAFQIDLGTIANACGYKQVFRATSRDELVAILPEFVAADGPVMLEVRVQLGARKDLGRPTMTPQELKRRFMGAAAAD